MLEMAWVFTVIGFVGLVVLLVLLFCMCAYAMREDKDSDGQ